MVPVANALLARAAVPQANVVSLEPQKARQPYECHENTTCPNVCFSPVKAKTILTVYIGNWFSTVSTGNQCREAVYILGIMGCALLSLPPSFLIFIFLFLLLQKIVRVAPNASVQPAARETAVCVPV